MPSVYLFVPLTPEARTWVDENVELEDWQWLGGGFGVDHRYAKDLADGMTQDGLVVDTDFRVEG